MLPTYSLQVCTNMHPHPVCCQPTAYKFAQTCILTLYVANLQPTSLHKHASSPCMLPTYSLQVCTNMHPHPVCCQPTAYKFAQTCILTLYVANLQPTSLHKHASSPCMLPTYSLQVCTSMHPHPVCCQPTAYKFAQTCILTLYVANLQPTSLHKHASSPCMLPTYSLQVCTSMHPHPVCCQPTAYKFAQTCILTVYVANLQPTSLHKPASSPCMLPTYSLQVCTNMHPHPVCCQPTVYKFAQTCILTLYVANLQPTSLHKHASSPCMLPTYSLQVCTNMHPHRVCCQPTAYKFAQTCILTVYVANLQPTSLHKHASSPCMLPTYSLQVGPSMHPRPVCCQPTAYKFAQTCILTLHLANLQPASSPKHASSPCMLPTYSLQVCTNMHPHRVCCQPTAYKFAPTCILTVYVANLQPTSLHKHASSPCMLPTYSLQVCTNMHPHAASFQPTAYKFAQTCILALYVANLQPASWPNMHPHRVCCQPTAHKLAQACILTLYVANLQHVSSPCMLPTYSLQVCTNMHPHHVCCQPTAYKFAQTCILTLYVANLQPTSLHKHASSPCMLPTYSLQVCTNMHPHPVCCQPTAYKFAQTCILTLYVANLQPTSLHKHASSPCMLPTYSLQVCTNMHPHPVCCQPTAYKFAQTCILALYVASLQPTSLHKHASSRCILPTYSLQVRPTCILALYVANLQPASSAKHASSPCMLPTYSLQVGQTCILTVCVANLQPASSPKHVLALYVANLQSTSLHKHASSPCMLPTYSLQVCTNMHPHPVCCQPTAYKFAQTCILTVCVANLQPTSLHKHVSSPCMLPTYSLQVCTNMHPHPVCCQPTACKLAQACILALYVANLQPTSLHKHASSRCILPTYSLQVRPNMHPRPVCCQPTAYKFAQTCILTVYVANLQPTSLPQHASSPCMLPTYSLQVCTSMHPHPVCCQPTAYKFAQTCILTLHLSNLQPTSSPKHASSPCMLPTYSLQVGQTCILTVYVANLQPTSWPKHASSPCMLPTYSMYPHRVCCQPTAYKFAQTCILTMYVANLQPTSLHKHASSPCMLPTYSPQVCTNMHPHRVCCQPTAYKFAQTCILTLYVANLQPTSLHKHASSPCMLPTYSLQVCTNMHPHPVCCQPTAYKFAQTCILTVYVANLQPTSLHKHASSPCMLPAYSLQVCTNMHPHAASCQPTACKFAQHASSPCMLPTYSLQVRPNMHPRPVCCQPTACKLAKHASSPCVLPTYSLQVRPNMCSPCMLPTCSLQVRPTILPHPLANLQPTSWPKHASSPCMLPTYSLQVGQTCILTVCVANLQPTSFHNHVSSPCRLPTYSLQVCTNMQHRGGCHPTAPIARKCANLQCVAILAQTCNALQWPDFSCSLKRRLATCPNSIAARLYRRALRSATEHGIP